MDPVEAAAATASQRWRQGPEPLTFCLPRKEQVQDQVCRGGCEPVDASGATGELEDMIVTSLESFFGWPNAV